MAAQVRYGADVKLRSFLASDILARAGLVARPDAHGGTGLFAARDLPAGFELVVPTRWVLDASSAGATRLGAAVLGAGMSQEDALLVVLADARPPRATGSPWAPYAEVLPSAAPDVGSWPEELTMLLDGTDLGAALVEAEKDLVDLHARVGAADVLTADAMLALDDLRWARGMLLSRRFPDLQGRGDAVESGKWGDVGSMVPLLDYLNHDHAAMVTTVGFEDEHWDGGIVQLGGGGGGLGAAAGGAGAGASDGVGVKNAAPCREGQEVLHNYGTTKSNEELMAMYGFALPRNQADRVMLLVPSPVEGAEPVRCYVNRAGMTEELFEAVMTSVGGQGGEAEEEEEEDVDEAELVAVVSEASTKKNVVQSTSTTAPPHRHPANSTTPPTPQQTSLGEAIAAKLNELNDNEPTDAAYSALESNPGYAARVSSVRHYRRGVAEVLVATLRECEAMAQVVAGGEPGEGGGFDGMEMS